MLNAEEYILDIKVEDKAMPIANNSIFSPVYEIEDIDSDCSTITATEIECQQKNLRVFIKKLPQKVLDKYFPRNNLNSSMTPSRTSKRLKILPAKYRFIDMNITGKGPSKHKTATETKQIHNCAGKSTEISKNSITISKTKIDNKKYSIKSNKSSNETHAEVNRNDSIMMQSSKILVIKQPVLKNDPLNIPNNMEILENDLKKSNSNRAEEKDMDTDDSNGSEIVERIFFNNKSVQTKFTCNGSICGLVDSDEFNLNCFYCYEIFPLHKWLEFKQHIKQQHHVVEKQNPKQTLEQIINDDGLEPTVNKSILRSQEINRIQLKSIEDLNRKTPIFSTPYNNNKEKQPRTSKNNGRLFTLPKKPLLKNPACYINLDQYNKKSPATKLFTNQQLNQSKSTPTKLNSKNHLNQTEEFIDLTSDNRIRERSSSNDDLSRSCAEEIISIGDDEEEDKEFDQIIENFSKEFLGNDQNNDIALKSTSNPNILPINNSANNVATPTASSATQFIAPNLPHITIRKLEAINASAASAQTPHTSSMLKKAYIKLPTNLSIEDVLKTIPKPTISQQNSRPLNPTKPRYFVVKKVKPMATENAPKINLPIGTIITKIPSFKENDDDDDMPSNDENEDEVPKPTNGCGILFGLTHRDVVLQFLSKLKAYPELWRPHIKTNTDVNYDQSIEELCEHLNNRFDLNIENFEMRLSIQRVKDWYCRMLKNIFLHNQNRNNIVPYKHTFPEYFKILNKFLTSDVHYTKNLLLSKSLISSNTSITDYPKWMVYKQDRTMHKVENTHLEDEIVKGRKPQKPSTPKKPIIKFKATKLPDDDSSQNVIEFDADALYGNESTDDEKSQAPEKPKSKWKPMYPVKYKYQYPKKTKVYCPVVPIVCDICNRNFKRNIDLRRHRVGHFPPKFQCALCSQMFHHKHWAERCSHGKKKKRYAFTDDDIDSLIVVSPTKIKSKIPKQPNFRKWMCEICGVSYRSVGSLNAHKRDKHLNQRLKCVVCKFTAVTNYRIVQHQKKRHVVEPGTVEEVATKCRARMDSKTPFTPEARQEFDWRREQRKKLNPGELFYGCCKCRIIFQTRKEKVLHNKLEHPIKDTTVICLLCHPEKMLLSNSNSVRRHYTDIHKVPWDEIDDLVKRTKPIFQLLDKDEIELLNSSENYSDLLTELLIKKKLKLDPDPIKEEATQAVENLSTQHKSNEIEVGAKEHNNLINVTIENSHDGVENVFVDGIIDHDYNNGECENYKYEHDYNENREHNNYEADESNNNNDFNDDEQINVNNDDDSAHTELLIHRQSNDQEGVIDEDGVYTIHYEGELVEESIVEEFVADDFIEEDTIEDYF